ncbi:putative bifunctional diguanylate cyclase/phosphodiesterase [Cellulomonas bogoriensis]|uniref:Diguanylate cyclase n=1 Tax=Cellulomonas bogoriensis 69B4 = DSM 16987 TaxID=1386082 RepID=A0A0A0BRY8_9CELL|nr:EAL domain-containing protein [Cellulomonas bogoriensis]KGM10427.1 diguanylate cyclase [Cellulomonas bogoriensis 69B4 = DSM 16987]
MPHTSPGGPGRDAPTALEALSEVASALLQDPGRATDLSWLEGKGVRAATLALWDEGPQDRLRVVGTYGPTEVVRRQVTTTDGPGFAPVGLDVGPDDVCHVVPVGEADHPRGVLTVVPGSTSAVPAALCRGWAALIATALDRTDLAERLCHGALHDPVTGLPNRRLFVDRLEVAVEQLTRRHAAGFAVVFLEVDGLTLVNDSLGHAAGDMLLREIAARLRSELRTSDTAARFGGAEFAVLLSDPVPEEVLVITERMQQRIAAPVRLGDQEVAVTANAGITTSELVYTRAEDVLRDAATAMHHATRSDEGTASVFDHAMHARAAGRLRTRGELRTALAHGQFVVHYQPIVALDGSGLSHFEALVRWDHPERGLVGPGEFLGPMEENSTIVQLGQWVIDEVCRQVAAWRQGYTGGVTVSVNVSHLEFWSPTLVSTVAEALERHDVPPECLVLEITETVIMADARPATAVMQQLRDLGVRLHIDDFGTGHSSLTALRTLPVDALKIDGSFIRELTLTARTHDLVEIILYMGRVLGLEVIAECVETTDQAQRLEVLGCANAQGWLYARALPGPAAGTLLGTSLARIAAEPLAST